MRTKHQAGRETLQRSLQSTKVSITDHHKLPTSHDPAVSCPPSTAGHQVVPKFNSNNGEDPSMAMAAMIQCTKSTSSLLRTRQCLDGGTQRHQRIVWSRAIQAHSRQSVRRIRWDTESRWSGDFISISSSYSGHKVSSSVAPRPRVTHQKIRF